MDFSATYLGGSLLGEVRQGVSACLQATRKMYWKIKRLEEKYLVSCSI